MINTFSLILIIFTGLSGLFWFLNKLHKMCNNSTKNNWIIFDKIRNFFRYSNNFYNIVALFFLGIYECISSMFPVLLCVFIVRSFIFEPFQIPSGSMLPTLWIGDLILVNKFIYGVKDPISNKTLINIGEPQRGDLIVFKYPKDPKLNYIKRVIGKPGDKVIYNVLSKQLMIYPLDKNGKSNQALPIVYTNIMLSNFIQTFYKSKDGIINTDFLYVGDSVRYPSDGIRLIKTTESLPGIKYDILTMISPGDTRFLQIYGHNSKNLVSEWFISDNEYFVMGDNRDNSSDSRYWGCVPKKNIVGKAIVIWMSLEKKENQWPTGVRFNRIGFVQ